MKEYVPHVDGKVKDPEASGSGHCESCTDVLCALKYTRSLSPIVLISGVTIGPIAHLRVLHFSMKAIAGSSIKEVFAFSDVEKQTS